MIFYVNDLKKDRFGSYVGGSMGTQFKELQQCSSFKSEKNPLL